MKCHDTVIYMKTAHIQLLFYYKQTFKCHKTHKKARSISSPANILYTYQPQH